MSAGVEMKHSTLVPDGVCFHDRRRHDTRVMICLVVARMPNLWGRLGDRRADLLSRRIGSSTYGPLVSGPPTETSLTCSFCCTDVISLEDWALIRHLRRSEGRSQRAIARQLGIARDTVAAALASDGAPKYVREPVASAIDAVERPRMFSRSNGISRYGR
jgi:hypothetical protein